MWRNFYLVQWTFPPYSQKWVNPHKNLTRKTTTVLVLVVRKVHCFSLHYYYSWSVTVIGFLLKPSPALLKAYFLPTAVWSTRIQKVTRGMCEDRESGSFRQVVVDAAAATTLRVTKAFSSFSSCMFSSSAKKSAMFAKKIFLYAEKMFYHRQHRDWRGTARHCQGQTIKTWLKVQPSKILLLLLRLKLLYCTA